MEARLMEQYRHKLTTADEAVRHIQSGWRIFLGSGCAVPQTLLAALVKHAGSFHDLELIQLLAFGTADYFTKHHAGHLRHNSFFISSQIREAVCDGRADYTPIFLSEIPELIRSGQRGNQVALLQLSPPDRHGYCSMGINVDIQRAALDRAKLVIAEINPRMPRTFGDSAVHLDSIDLIVESDVPILVSEPKEPDEVELQIGYHISRLVENGSCLQIGIGAIPGTVLKFIADKRDLGIHTEMFSEQLLPLIEQGTITNRLKKVHPGKSVASFVIGSHALYDFVDGNPGVEFHPSDYVNDPRVISANDRVVAINSALQVDLTGQICADSIGYKFYSGIGGQVDFTRGAAMSRGGKPVIAIRSRGRDNGASRIVPRIDDGTGVVTSRGDAHYVVSEYGIAYLHGKTIRERALALISIAHPDYRRELLEFVKNKHYVYEDEQVWQQALDRYPRECEETRSFAGRELQLRPLKAVDERLLQEFFYSLDPESVYNRFFGSKVQMAHREAAKLVCIDYDSRMALAVFDRQEGIERMVAVARYAVNPRTAMAETAVVVHEDYRRLGITRHLMRRLELYARSRGVEGFQAEILPNNEAMLRYHRELGHSLVFSQESGYFHMEYRFEG
ncbi:bifunctional acetyl-CoA hydrolase/transferase family protein/GNAT family N-acetyltransferase [Geomonas anaerohicana]|uniref:GNAT family N-acetyltransferase n=1 Tax=Geomonas anaerohicana TaxID=2798583 RepID=A0ABS0YB35_9BACT|nr:bifunctional acetyl-CoA hydrolase/transferase family protein/GNAT family N-acetyltransferase [Geomonas anaerohicana]MBJ6749513.1 GNAT family N-acetyltransferase [Geomonas anaerohicana]